MIDLLNKQYLKNLKFAKSKTFHIPLILTAFFNSSLSFAKPPISLEFCNDMKREFTEIYAPQFPIVLDNITQIISMNVLINRNEKCIINAVYEVEITKLIAESAKEEGLSYESIRKIYASKEVKSSIIDEVANIGRSMANNNIVTPIKKYSNWELNTIYRFDDPLYGTYHFKVIDQ